MYMTTTRLFLIGAVISIDSEVVVGSLFSSVLLGYGSPARNVWVVLLAARWRVDLAAVVGLVRVEVEGLGLIWLLL